MHARSGNRTPHQLSNSKALPTELTGPRPELTGPVVGTKLLPPAASSDRSGGLVHCRGSGAPAPWPPDAPRTPPRLPGGQDDAPHPIRPAAQSNAAYWPAAVRSTVRHAEGEPGTRAFPCSDAGRFIGLGKPRQVHPPRTPVDKHPGRQRDVEPIPWPQASSHRRTGSGQRLRREPDSLVVARHMDRGVGREHEDFAVVISRKPAQPPDLLTTGTPPAACWCQWPSCSLRWWPWEVPGSSGSSGLLLRG